MSEYERVVSSQRRWLLFLLGMIIIGLFVTPYRKIFLGLLLGSSVSFLNMVFLQNRVKAFGEAVVEGEGVSLGTLVRLANAGLTIAFSLQFKNKIHIWSVVIGLVLSYIVMTIDIFVRAVIDMRRFEKNFKNHRE